MDEKLMLDSENVQTEDLGAFKDFDELEAPFESLDKDSLIKMASRLQDDNTKLRAVLMNQRRETAYINELESQRNSLIKELQDSRQENYQLQVEAETAVKDSEKKSLKLKEWDDIYYDLEIQVGLLKDQYKKVMMEKAQFEMMKTSTLVTDQLADLTSQIEAANKENVVLKEQLATVNTKYIDIINGLEQRQNELLNTHQLEIDQLREEWLKDFATTEEQFLDEAATLHASIDALTKENELLLATTNIKEESLSSVDIDNLALLKSKIRSTVEMLGIMPIDHENQFESLFANFVAIVNSYEEIISDAKEKLTEYQEQEIEYTTQFRVKLLSYETEISTLHESDASKSAEIINLQQKLQETIVRNEEMNVFYRGEIQRLQSSLLQYTSKVEQTLYDYDIKGNELNSRLEDLMTTLSQVKGHSEHNKHLLLKVHDLEREVDRRSHDVFVLQRELFNIKNEEVVKDDKIDELEREITSARDNAMRDSKLLNEQIQVLAAESSSKDKQLESCDETIKMLKGEVENTGILYSEAVAQLNATNQLLSKYHTTMNENENENKQLKDQLEYIREGEQLKNEEMTKQITDLTTQKQLLRDDLYALKESLENKMLTIQSLENASLIQAGKMNDLELRKDAYESEIKSMKVLMNEKDEAIRSAYLAAKDEIKNIITVDVDSPEIVDTSPLINEELFKNIPESELFIRLMDSMLHTILQLKRELQSINQVNITMIEEEVRSLEEQVKTLMSENEELMNSETSLIEKVDSYYKCITEKEEYINKLKHEIHEISSASLSLSTLTDTINDELMMLKDHHDNQMDDTTCYQAEIDETKKQKEQLLHELAKYESIVKEKESLCNSLKSNMEEAYKKLSDREAECSNLTLKISELEQSVNEQRAILVEKERGMEFANSEIENLKNRIENYQVIEMVNSEKIEKLAEAHLTEKKKLEERIVQFEISEKERMNEIEDARKQLLTRIDESQFNSFKESNIKLQQEITNKDMEYQKVQEKYQSYKASTELMKSAIEKSESEISKLQGEIKSLVESTALTKDLEEENLMLMIKIEELQCKIQGFHDQLTAKDLECLYLKEDLEAKEQAKQQIKNLIQVNEELEAQIELAKKEVEDLKNSTSTATEKKANSDSECQTEDNFNETIERLASLEKEHENIVEKYYSSVLANRKMLKKMSSLPSIPDAIEVAENLKESNIKSKDDEVAQKSPNLKRKSLENIENRPSKDIKLIPEQAKSSPVNRRDSTKKFTKTLQDEECNQM